MKLIRFILKATVVGIATLVILAAASFAVSNRAPATMNLWPLPFEFSLPLGTTLLATLAVGIFIGTALMSLSRLRLWFRARRNERKAETLERAVRRQAEAQDRAAGASNGALPSPPNRPALSDS